MRELCLYVVPLYLTLLPTFTLPELTCVASFFLAPYLPTESLWLLAWMANNIGVTLINKACFSSTVNFRYPYFLSAIHMVCNMAGAALMILYNKHNGNSCRNSKSLLPQQHRIHSSNIAINSSNEENYIPVNQILPLLKNGRASGGTLRKSPRLVTDFPKPLLCDPNDASTSSSSSSAFSRTKKKKKKKNTILWIRRPTLDAKEQRLILVFSVIFSLNIAIGNVSLRHVSVNFNQVMRSLVPVIAIALTYYGFHKSVSRRKILSVLPIVIGVVMTCFGDISFDTTGFMVTVACIVLAALKAVASGEMLTGALKLHPIDLLSRMAPLALIQCLGAAFAQGEMRQILRRWSTDFSPIVNPYPMAVVWVSGILSFSLNLCSLQATKATSPLTLCIAANVKQVLLSKSGR